MSLLSEYKIWGSKISDSLNFKHSLNNNLGKICPYFVGFASKSVVR